MPSGKYAEAQDRHPACLYFQNPKGIDWLRRRRIMP
jgi:hypothetical protein